MARRKVAEPTIAPFVIRSSRIAGKGAFAARPIKRGERLIEYVGERLTHAAADARYDDHADDKHHTFLFAVNRSTVIDATFGGNDSRFINHSCDPNCESVIVRARVFIEAIRSIRTDEELSYDYAYTRDGTETEEEETTVYVCRCGSRKCRGTILAPMSKAELRRRAAAAKRHRRPHVHARSGQES